jgi:hypothetical protein
MSEDIWALITRGNHLGLASFHFPAAVALKRNVPDPETVLPCHKNGHAKPSFSSDITKCLANLIHIGHGDDRVVLLVDGLFNR